MRSMRKFGFSAMKAFLALSSIAKRDGRIDWLSVVTFWSTAVTVAVVTLYFLQRGS
jgi:hypothetical protein